MHSIKIIFGDEEATEIDGKKIGSLDSMEI
jgi:hypothetical protein